MSLTGRFWFRKTWTGKLVLLVEEKKARSRLFGAEGEFRLRWRDARLLDLAEVPMQPLMDLGRIGRPGFAGSRAAGLRVVEPPVAKAS
ncbi:hypothetical protein [Methylobacterium nigriterrae]|uniref:hypothetical protein n=1 Tax=Methylobacterium nigriterrae TaxID=3127512 RepID=UPI003014024F